MKFICDVHITYKLVHFLNKNGHEVIHVNQLPDKSETTDLIIAEIADKQDFIVVTKDQDFENLHFVRHTPKKLIRIVSGNISNEKLIRLFEIYLPQLTSILCQNTFFIEMSLSQIVCKTES